MVEVRNIRVFSTDRDEITVTWEIADTTEDLAGYTVALLRSESPTGPYNRVSPEMLADQVYELRDRGTNLLSNWREFFYRVRVTETGTGDTLEFGATPLKQMLRGENPLGVTMTAVPDLEALEAIRRFQMLLDEYTGREVLYLRERTWGQHCSDCWDTLKRRRTRSDCQTCFRTGFTGGYYPPVRTKMMKPPHQIVVALTPLLELQPHDVLMQFNAWPRLKPRDIIIDTENRRWRVISVQERAKGQARTGNTVQLRMVTRDQVEYKIPIRGWGEDNMTVAPHRQYIRATDRESYAKAAQQLGFGEEQPNQIKELPTQMEEA